MYYFLNENKSYRPCSIEEWSSQKEDMFRNDWKHIADDLINGYRVSTVWLGLDHNHFGGEPLLFETMVFEGYDYTDLFMKRYSTYEDAKRGHEIVVGLLKANRLEDLRSMD